MDRLVWQDVDASTLSTEQLTALRGWLALGGRLLIVGGTTGIGTLGGFPDDILPYRPTSTVDVAPASLRPLLGALPKEAADVPAMAGELAHGRSLAASGDRTVAAQATYGGGTVTILGFDPTVGWLRESAVSSSLWPALIPPRSEGSVALADDTQIVGAVSNLPSLELPPLGGLLALLFGYIALIGPVNYLVLRRLDRREWAWVTIPVLIVAFAVGAYAFGSALRGSSVIVNEVAVVRGAPDATEATAQVYLGVFSPTRGTYQVAVPGGALLSSPISGDIFGGQSASLDIVQGDPSRVRDLGVGVQSLRTIRAESQVVAPKIHADLKLIDGTLTGTVRNEGTTTLEKPAVVLGANVKVLKDLAPGEEVAVSLGINGANFGQALSDRIFGQLFFDGTTGANEGARRDQVRYQVLSQLTNDPQTGTFGRLPADGPVLLAWGRDAILDVAIEGQAATRLSNVLYYVPLSMPIQGRVLFLGDLLNTTVVESDAGMFTKDPSTFSFGRGSTTVSYRPLPFDGTLSVSHVRLGFSFGPEGVIDGGVPIQPLPPVCQAVLDRPSQTTNDRFVPAPGCPKPLPADQFDGLPEIEVFDRTASKWERLPHPAQGQPYDLASPGRYVDPATGAFLVRYVNERDDPVGFSAAVAIEGTVK
jgi:hypothetical protein